MNNTVFKAKGFEIRSNSYNGYTLTYNGKYLATMFSNKKNIIWTTWVTKKQKERIKALEKRIAKLYNEIDSLTESLTQWEELPNVIQEEFLKEYQNGHETETKTSKNT